MKHFITKLSLFVLYMATTLSYAYAARMYIEAPKTASSNREPFSFTVFLDGEGSSISGLSGDVSFPSELFDVKTISTYNGIVSVWMNEPHVSLEKRFDQRTHVIFEGIIPGGFSGVRTPFAPNAYPGIVFTVTLVPKSFGKGDITLTNPELHAFDDRATNLVTRGDSSPVSVPVLSGKEFVPSKELRIIDNTTVSMVVNHSELVNDNSPYVYVREEDPSRTIDHIEIAETNEYNPSHVSVSQWRTVTNPYVLAYSSRTKYIHAKIVYTNNTYSLKTVPPVENSNSFTQQSRILVYILIAISLLYHYGKNFLYLLSKKRTKHT